MIADSYTYLSDLTADLQKMWPDNEYVNIVCHGHSVPAGYFMTPQVDSLRAYPGLLREALARRYPWAVINVIVTAIGGEESASGAERFRRDVLSLRPRAVTMDYGLNDRGIGLEQAAAAWRRMIREALEEGCKVILLTPSWDTGCFRQGDARRELEAHAEQIRGLAEEYGTGLCDSFAAFEDYVNAGGDPRELLSQVNHPNGLGHELIAKRLTRWFLPA